MKDIGLNRVKGYFDEGTPDNPKHDYVDEHKTKYTSCTTFVHKFEKPFDKEYWSKYKAKERGVSVETILAEWDGINKMSLERGNRIHNALEDGINDAYNRADKEKQVFSTGSHSDSRYQESIAITTIAELRKIEVYKTYPMIREYLEKLLVNDYVLYAEYKLFRPEIKLAGMVDLLAIKNNDVIIVDWKTNKKPMLFRSGYFKKKWQNGVKVETNQFIPTLDMMLKPINNIFACLGMTYTLQLSMYAYMVSMYGFNVKALVLFHIKPVLNEDEVKVYVLDNKREAIVSMLKHDNRI